MRRRKSKNWAALFAYSFIAFSIALLLLFILIDEKNKPKVQQSTPSSSGGLPINNSSFNGSVKVYDPRPSDIDLGRLFNLVNIDRQENNIWPLTIDPRLNNSAQSKCDDMVSKNYWSHISPVGKAPWEFIKEAGINYYLRLGENLGAGQDSAEQVNDAWMKSEEHKTNILNADFQYVGYAVCLSEHNPGFNGEKGLFIVQHFAEL